MVMHKASRFGIQILEVIHRVPGVEQYVAEVRHRGQKLSTYRVSITSHTRCTILEHSSISSHLAHCFHGTSESRLSVQGFRDMVPNVPNLDTQ